MGNPVASDRLEREAYRASSSDGIIDLFAGLAATWIGIAWIWLPDMAALAGILPAVLVAPILAYRNRFVEARLGYVRWRPARRRWERRSLGLMLAIGLGLLAAAIILFLVADGPSGDGVALSVAPAIMAWLLALIAIILAILLSEPRVLAYAFLLLGTGALAALVDANPGWPLLVSGVVIAITGAAMVWRFVQRYPVSSAA